MQEGVLSKECQGNPPWTFYMFLYKTEMFLNTGKET